MGACRPLSQRLCASDPREEDVRGRHEASPAAALEAEEIRRRRRCARLGQVGARAPRSADRGGGQIQRTNADDGGSGGQIQRTNATASGGSGGQIQCTNATADDGGAEIAACKRHT